MHSSRGNYKLWVHASKDWKEVNYKANYISIKVGDSIVIIITKAMDNISIIKGVINITTMANIIMVMVMVISKYKVDSTNRVIAINYHA